MALDMAVIVGGTGLLVAAGVTAILVTAPSGSTHTPATFEWYAPVHSASKSIDITPSPPSPAPTH